MRIATRVAIAGMLVAGPVLASGATMKEEKPGLLKRAEITPAAATATAQRRLRKGKIESSEIEEEGGRLIYSFDITTAGKTGIDEVNVDAHTGKVLGVSHESPQHEAKEKAADSKKR